MTQGSRVESLKSPNPVSDTCPEDSHKSGNTHLSSEIINSQKTLNEGGKHEPSSSGCNGNISLTFEIDLSGLGHPDDPDNTRNDESSRICVRGKDNCAVENPPEEVGEGRDRETWDNQLEFLLTCIAMSVGLGNVWRFPFIAYRNGGGAFLVPYLIVLVFIGRPICYLDMCLGQFSRYGMVKVWNMAPMFKGVGYISVIGLISIVSFYCSIIAQTVFYFVASFAKVLPWSVCDKSWGGDLCYNETHVNPQLTNASVNALYYELEAFPIKGNIDDGLGAPEWRLTLCLLFSWAFVFCSLIKGVQSQGKVAYFTALFPYAVILILLIRGVTLPGAWEGIVYFIRPQWDKLYEPEVWYEAVSQCFFSLTFGTTMMLSSYNPFRHNVYKDAMIVSFMDTITSFLAGCTIFAVLGYLKQKMGVEDITDVTPGGPSLAFISYPEAIAQFDWVPQLFSVLFFLMLFALGIGSATSLTDGIITVICDQFPKWRRWIVTFVICIGGFLSGLIYVTPGGNFMVDLVNHFGASFVIYIMVMVEVFAVSWVYGLENFCRDLEFMLGVKVGWFMRLCWGYVIPIGLLLILVYTMATQQELTYGGVAYPKAAIICGWLLAAFSVSSIPIMGLHTILTRKQESFVDKFKASMRPTREWGPQNPKLRREWEDFKKNYPTGK